jgi:hypothetical protein
VIVNSRDDEWTLHDLRRMAAHAHGHIGVYRRLAPKCR